MQVELFVANLRFVGSNPANVTGFSNKFYDVSVLENKLVIAYGACGRAARNFQLECRSYEDAVREARKRVSAKIKEGYRAI